MSDSQEVSSYSSFQEWTVEAEHFYSANRIKKKIFAKTQKEQKKPLPESFVNSYYNKLSCCVRCFLELEKIYSILSVTETTQTKYKTSLVAIFAVKSSNYKMEDDWNYFGWCMTIKISAMFWINWN